jgi:hypothetical protein
MAYITNIAWRRGRLTALNISGPQPFATAVARNIAPGSTAGIPGLVLPAGLTSSGLPIAPECDRRRELIGIFFRWVLVWRLFSVAYPRRTREMDYMIIARRR